MADLRTLSWQTKHPIRNVFIIPEIQEPGWNGLWMADQAENQSQKGAKQSRLAL